MIKAEWTKADALDLQPTCNNLATDTISRQALCEYSLNQKDKSVTPNDIATELIMDTDGKKMIFVAGQKGELMTDLISREEAIDLAYECEDEFGKDVAFRFAYYLRHLPSAQPELKTGTLDLISRAAAIDLAHELIVPNEYKYGLYNQAINNYCVEIMNLPSAQPEIIPCGDCKHHHRDGQGLQYCDRIDYGYGWKDEDFCSRAERNTNETD